MRTRLILAGTPVFSSPGKRAFLFLVAACGALAGCERGEPARLEPRDVQRIVSVVPSATEAIVLLGAADRLVARTDYDRDARIAHLPSLGRTMQPGAESVHALRPDLFIDADYTHSSVLSATLARHGIETLTVRLERTREIAALIDTLGVLLDRRAAADSISRVLRTLEAPAGDAQISVLYVVWPLPVRTAAGDSYLTDILRFAGARNVFADVREKWPEVSIEAVVARDPDVVLVPAEPGDRDAVARITRLPGWRVLRAVKQGRVYAVDATLFGRPGVRMAEAVDTLARIFSGIRR